MSIALSRRGFLLSSGSLGLAVTGCESADAPALSPAPAPSPASVTLAPATPSIAPVGGPFPFIADTAQRLDATLARALRNHGVRTVFRYYSHLPPSLPGKDLQPEEAQIILGEGLSIGSVWQHHNNCFRTFENAWGREDAEQALRMASAAGQPQGSAIYFGVDADWPYAAMRDPIVKYFEDVERTFEGSGISVGVYSNGCICNDILEKGLAEYFWLSGSTGHSGTQAFYNTGAWTLFQNSLDITPPQLGYAIDTDIANPSANGYFGQWTDRGARAAAHPAWEANGCLASRRFLRMAADVKEIANVNAATVARLRKDQNVRLVGTEGDWALVVTQEGAPSAGANAATGWLPMASLAPMNRFPDNASTYGLCGAAITVSDSFKYQTCERAVSRLR